MKVIQAGIKQYSLVVSVITPRLEAVGQEMSQCKPTYIYFYLMKSLKLGYLHWILIWQDKMNLQVSTTYQNSSKPI